MSLLWAHNHSKKHNRKGLESNDLFFHLNALAYFLTLGVKGAYLFNSEDEGGLLYIDPTRSNGTEIHRNLYT